MPNKMTIRQCMDFALQLLNQYSITGTLVPLSYNDQSDTELRMINLINDAQMEIAKTVKPIVETMTVEIPEPERGAPIENISVSMPEDFICASRVYFTPANGLKQTMEEGSNYMWLGDDTLLLPNRPAGTYRIEYHRFPVRYDKDVDKSTELDNTPDTHEAIPYYIAAVISLDENQRAYFALYNIWETRLSRLGYKPAHAVRTFVHDVYGFDNFLGVDC